MFGLLIWWYLVAYQSNATSPNATSGITRVIQDAMDSMSGGSPIGEYLTQVDCEGQLNIFYLRNPYGFARCEGYSYRQDFTTIEKRKQRDLEMRKLELDVENRSLEAEIRQRILKGELAPETRSK